RQRDRGATDRGRADPHPNPLPATRGEGIGALRGARGSERYALLPSAGRDPRWGAGSDMWIVRLALRRPYTFIVLGLLILILGPLAILRTPTDVFPTIDIPVVSV